MTLRDIALLNMRRRKAKAGFILMGLMIGVATVVALITLFQSMSHNILHKMEKYGANILVVPKSESLSLSYGGISMGGFITQVLAAKHPNRVLSMASIMSASGNIDPQIIDALWSQRLSREAFAEEWVDYIRAFGSPKFSAGDDHSRSQAAAAFDRCYSPDGANRQILAILSAKDIDLQSLVKTISIPALVVHGENDGLIPPDRGRETADLIPNAKFVLVHGMGHDTPPKLGKPLADIVLEHIQPVGSYPSAD